MDYRPILISLKTAGAAMIITFFLGIFAARFVNGLRHKKWKLLFDGIFTLPLVLPPTVAGFFLLYLFGVNRVVGKFFIDYFHVKIAFSWGATVIAAVVMSFPLMYRSVRGALEQIDPNIIHAARTLGIPEGRIFWRICMPSALPGVISGGILSLARGLGEFGATTMIAGNIAGKTRTLPLAIYSAVAAGDMDTAMEYVAIIVIISFIMIVAMNYILGRKGN